MVHHTLKWILKYQVTVINVALLSILNFHIPYFYYNKLFSKQLSLPCDFVLSTSLRPSHTKFDSNASHLYIYNRVRKKLPFRPGLRSRSNWTNFHQRFPIDWTFEKQHNFDKNPKWWVMRSPKTQSLGFLAIFKKATCVCPETCPRGFIELPWFDTRMFPIKLDVVKKFQKSLFQEPENWSLA